MSEASPKKFLECCGAIMLKLVLNLSTLCMHDSHGPRTNAPPYNQDVWSTKLDGGPKNMLLMKVYIE